ncbi:TPA: hypothetical protein GX533_03500 [Candidatus Dojkabacteria bacterium]|uniref:Uncharacterized protein n=1 Tax=Candidatus Dojkabacteria bacterium TaxID=2099670 RepID=A0A832R998_9BACT|nr:hypothetical protein [Candidatus Dojkabacteria bacterium]
MTDKKENENSLDSYTLDELKSVSLPTNLALHAHPIQVEEGKSEYSKTMENLGEVVSELNRRLGDEKCAFGGSMAMYLLWNNLMKEDSSIDIKDRLNERIRGGKNDYDLMLESGRKNSVMEKLGFKDSDMKLERGLVANHMVDILHRPEKRSFPNEKIIIKEQEFYVQNPYDSLFEKLTALAYPQIDDSGNERPKELKWGVDAKLYKLYLQLSDKISEDELNEKLAELWPKYKEETREVRAKETALEMDSGKSAKDIIANMFKMPFSSDEELILKAQELYPNVPTDLIVDLIGSVDKESFVENIMRVFKIMDKESDSYSEMHSKAEENYSVISLEEN